METRKLRLGGQLANRKLAVASGGGQAPFGFENLKYLRIVFWQFCIS